MEVLISVFVGTLLMETYALLNPATRWLIRRAAQKLPEEYRATFTDMVTADVDALPHSISKIAFVLYNCTVTMDAIYQELARDKLQLVADEYDDFVDTIGAEVDDLLDHHTDVMRKCQTTGEKFASTLNVSGNRSFSRTILLKLKTQLISFAR